MTLFSPRWRREHFLPREDSYADIQDPDNLAMGDLLVFNANSGKFEEKDAHGYGTLYVAGGVTAQGLLAATPEDLTLLVTEGNAHNTVLDGTLGTITVEESGMWYFSFNAAYVHSVSPTTITFTLATDTVAGPYTVSSDAADTVFLNGTLNLVAGTVLSILVEAADAGDLTVSDAQFTIHRIGPYVP